MTLILAGAAMYDLGARPSPASVHLFTYNCRIPWNTEQDFPHSLSTVKVADPAQYQYSGAEQARRQGPLFSFWTAVGMGAARNDICWKSCE